MPYKEQAISLLSKNVGDVRSVDPDGDGNDELLFGGSGFRTDMGGSKYNVASAMFTQYNLRNNFV